MKRVYLDVCVLCRPFDDQQQARIHLEAKALDLILAQVETTTLEFVVSPVHQVEINAIHNLEKRQHLLLLLDQIGGHFDFDLPLARQRAEKLTDAGMGLADAAHVALAELIQADFVTVDDRLLRQCRRLGIKTWYGSPLAYCDKENLQ